MSEINEIKDVELDQVNGGSSPIGPKQPIQLTGPYWASSDMSGAACRTAIGWQGLFIQQYNAGRAPFLITRNGTPIGWTIAGNFYIQYWFPSLGTSHK